MKTFAEGGLRVILFSSDTREEARKFADELECDSAFGMTREQAEELGVGWRDAYSRTEGHAPFGQTPAHAEPAAFLLARNGKLLSTSYSSTPSFGVVQGLEVASRLNWLLSYPKAWRPEYGL